MDINIKDLLGPWHIGSAFVFCPGDCLFESKPSPTSANACGEVTSCMPAAKWSARVAPKVDHGECILHSPPQKSEKGRTRSGFETQRRCHQKSKTGVPVAPKGQVSAKNFIII